MKTFFAFLLILMSCRLLRAQNHSSDNDISPQAPYGEEMAETRPGVEGGEEEQVLLPDIWAELKDLRDMVVKQTVELRYLTERLAAAESLGETLQEQNSEQAFELAVIQQKLSTLQDRVTVSEDQVMELKKQQEGQNVTVLELQNANRVREVAFSTSLLASGAGEIETDVCIQNLYARIITNIGNHYNPHTGYFTAPVRGMYYFRFTGHAAHSDAYLMLKLKKNDEFIIVAADRGMMYDTSDPEDNASNGAVLQLEVGDVVSVQTCGTVWDDQYHRTTFSGFMLFPL